MTTFPVPSGVIMLSGYGGDPLDPQPTELDVATAENGGYVGRWPDQSERHVTPPDPPMPPPDAPVVGIDNARADLLRQADALNNKGQTQDAIYMLLKGVLSNGDRL